MRATKGSSGYALKQVLAVCLDSAGQSGAAALLLIDKCLWTLYIP